MKRAVALAIVLAATVPPAWAQGEDDEEEAEDEPAEEEEEEEDEEEADPSAPSAKGKSATEEEEEGDDVTDDGLRAKQNLTGHDLGTNKRSNEFERDRFFVDKVDTEKTEQGTLVQGSIASSSFLYMENGGNYAGNVVGGNAGPSRLFTELRLQTDFRHIAASRWDARVDLRGRVVNTPDNAGAATTENRIQSGFNGENEYEVRELWLTRVGKRSDFFLGRQFVPDLGAYKFDGMRIDYAKSAKLTIIGFGGLYPVRGSRSVTTDYVELKQPGTASPAGRLVTTGGLGAAYRTVNTYGALGVVAFLPLKVEQARIVVTSNGYLRNGSKLDIYHFGLIDVIGSAGFALTNLSLGANVKPNPRLRLTANVNRVDTETLNIQAGAFLNQIDVTGMGGNVVQNEAFVRRLATNQARLGVSAGLGAQQRFEISTAMTYRYREAFTLTTSTMMNPTAIPLPAAKSVEVWASVVDRRSLAGMRLGIDGSRAFGVGSQSYQRSVTQGARLFALRELANGRGEWEAELAYTGVKNDELSAAACPPAAGTETQVGGCFGSGNNTLIAAGGQLVYRLKRDWLAIANAYLLRTTSKPANMEADPVVYGITGFLRIAKRF